MRNTTPLARLVALAAFAALPAAALAQEEKQQKQSNKPLPRVLDPNMVGKPVVLPTEFGPVTVTMIEPGMYEASMTFEGRKYRGYGGQLELDDKGNGANKLQLGFYREELLDDDALPAQGAVQSLGGQSSPSQPGQTGPEDQDKPEIEMTIEITGEDSCTCTCPTMLGRVVTITGNAARLLIGMMMESGKFLKHMIVDKVGKEFIVDTLAKRVMRDAIAKRFFRDFVGRKIFRDVIAKKVFRDALGKKVLRDAIGKKFFRDWIWRGGILRVGRFFNREFLHTRKPCPPEQKTLPASMKINRPLGETAPITQPQAIEPEGEEEVGLPEELENGDLDR